MTKAKLDTVVSPADFTKLCGQYGYRTEMVKRAIDRHNKRQVELGKKVNEKLTFRDAIKALRRLHYSFTGVSTTATRPAESKKAKATKAA